jgi:hypothetical protein
MSRPLSLGVLKGDANESLACARWHAERIKQHADWLKNYLIGPALKASLDGQFAADALLGALQVVEAEAKELQQILQQEAPDA